MGNVIIFSVAHVALGSDALAILFSPVGIGDHSQEEFRRCPGATEGRGAIYKNRLSALLSR